MRNAIAGALFSVGVLLLSAGCAGHSSSIPGALSPAAPGSASQSTTHRTHGDPPPPPQIAYNSVPHQLHGISSLGFECCQVNEFGDGVNLAQTGTLSTVSVVMDSWGCQSGHWNTDDCSTTPGSTFSEPITLNVYNVTATGSRVGTQLTTLTQTFNIPYRPSADAKRCTGSNAGEFFSDPDHACINGLANLITFNVPPGTTLPAQAIFTVAYNTSTSGYNPIGTSAPCYTGPGGCGYDSLNVGADGNGGPVGSPVDPNGTFVNYTLAGNYCDGGAGGSGFLRIDTGTNCWTGYHPQIKVTVSSTICSVITDSTGHTYTVANVGGDEHLDVEYSATPCDVGIYINGQHGHGHAGPGGDGHLDQAIVNGPFGIGVYFDSVDNARVDHTSICVNGVNKDGTCQTGAGSSNGTGLDVRNTPNFSMDHTNIDAYVAGVASNPCPNSANNVQINHTTITNSTYPWSFMGGNIRAMNASPPPPAGGTCAGSGIGDGH